MKKLEPFQTAGMDLDLFSKGAFLTVKDGDMVNTMTIGWGSVGYMWSRPILTVMVTSKRYTHELLSRATEFTVSIPVKDAKKALDYCGSHSGKDGEKLAAAGLSTLPGQAISTPVIDVPAHHYECKIVYRTDMTKENLADEIYQMRYTKNDFHTLYFGEIVTQYEE